MSAVVLTCGPQSVTLRSPDFDNHETVSLARVNRKTRGGDLVVFRDPSWPRDKIYKMPFSFLSDGQKDRLLAFLDYSLGRDVTLTDHEGRSVVGVITNPAGGFAQPGRFNYTVELEFLLNQDQF